jgi:hypothetical protein
MNVSSHINRKFVTFHSSGDVLQDASLELLEKTFLGCGFRIKTSLHDVVGNDDCHILFVAEQLRLSGDQVC